MIIIGEKINGAIPKTAAAIQNRDRDYIVSLVTAQEAAGADYLDVCAGTAPEEEYEALCWLIDIVQEVGAKPICIDSPDPRMIERVFPRLKKPGVINSISGEGDKCDVLLPLLRDNPEWQVVALCSNNGGIAAEASEKVRIAFELLERAEASGVTPDRVHIDPLVLALSAVNSSAVQFCKAVEEIKSRCPAAHAAAALSNISYGMPARACSTGTSSPCPCARAWIRSSVTPPTGRWPETSLRPRPCWAGTGTAGSTTTPSGPERSAPTDTEKGKGGGIPRPSLFRFRLTSVRRSGIFRRWFSRGPVYWPAGCWRTRCWRRWR